LALLEVHKIIAGVVRSEIKKNIILIVELFLNHL